MALHPRVFNDLAVSMVRAGQEGGFLEDVLTRVALFVEREQDLKAKVIGSLAYPVFLGCAGFVIVNVLVIFFVPQFEPIFAKMSVKQGLPTLTVWLLALSHFLQSWVGILGSGAIAFGVYSFFRWTRGGGREWADGVRLRVPLFGPVFRSLALSRFTRILGTMLQNGIPLLRALIIAKDSTGNKVLSNAIEQSVENITSGQKLAEPLRKKPLLSPTDVVEMIAVARGVEHARKKCCSTSLTASKNAPPATST